MAQNSDDELTPFGKILAVVGFFAGFSSVWQNNEEFWAAFIVGIIVAAIGGFVGNILWRILVVAIALAIAIGSFYVRQEVTHAVIDGIRESNRQNVYASKYMVCLENQTQNFNIGYKIRWENGSWENASEQLKPGWTWRYWGDYNLAFYISFDTDPDNTRENWKEYKLVAKPTSTVENCSSVPAYKFKQNGRLVELYNP